MDKKCSKYEGLFVFSDEDTLKKHLQECEECRQEQQQMDRVSELIDEVKLYYRAKDKKKRPKFRIACAMFLLIFSSLTAGVVVNDEDMMDTLRYGETLSAEDLGFPVDSYGLLMVGE